MTHLVSRDKAEESTEKVCKQCSRRLSPMYQEDLCPVCIENNLFNDVKDYIRKMMFMSRMLQSIFIYLLRKCVTGYGRAGFNIRVTVRILFPVYIAGYAESRFRLEWLVQSVILCKIFRLLQHTKRTAKRERCVL